MTMDLNALTILILSSILLSSGHTGQALSVESYATRKGPTQSKDTTTEWAADKQLFHPFTKQEWRSHQEKQINEVRKTRLRFKATYANKTAIMGARFHIKQTASDFQWGCGMTHRILNNNAYKNWFASRFTAAVFHNELKWYYIEREQGHENYTDPDAMIEFAREHNISVRGHTILWDDFKYQQEWVKTLSPKELQEAANRRVDSVVKRYRGKLISWDVVNENLHHHFFENHLGRNASAVFFNRVYNLDPKTTLYMNEFNTTESVDDKYAPPDKYLRKLKEIQSFPGNAGMLMGIGLQSHYGPEPIDLHYIRQSLTLLSEAGLPIWLTELDIKLDPTLPNRTQLQVRYLEEILRESFSHAAVKGIIIWTGSSIDGCSVMCMTDENLVNTPVGDLVDALIAEWKTGTIELVADSEGYSQASLFHGHYDATVIDPATNISTTMSLKVDNVNVPDNIIHLQING